jgi:hypothetical protein
MSNINYKVGDKIVRKEKYRVSAFEADNGPFVAYRIYGGDVVLDRNPSGSEYASKSWIASYFEKYVEPVQSQVKRVTNSELGRLAFAEMNPFKIGDIVRVVREETNGNVPYGLRDTTKTFKVTDVKGVMVVTEEAGGNYHSRFALVEAAKPEVKPEVKPEGRFIIAVEKNGKFAPASTPKEYGSYNTALDVAAQMAERYGGDFYVLKAVAKAHRAPPVNPPVIISAMT